MKKMKRITSLLLVFVMLCSLLQTAALAVGSDSAYTVSLSGDTRVEQGATLNVGVDVTSSSETAYSAFYATLTYNSSVFSYNEESSTLNEFQVEDDDGTLKIARSGGSIDISINPDLKLAFTARGVAGTGGSFALTSAKVDSAANAEKDAPDAALGPALDVMVGAHAIIPVVEGLEDGMSAEGILTFTVNETAVTQAANNQRIQVNLNLPEGYGLVGLTYTNSNGNASSISTSTMTFTMPAVDTTVTATIGKVYKITTKSEGITVWVAGQKKDQAVVGQRISMDVAPPTGYTLKSLTYTTDGGQPQSVSFFASGSIFRSSYFDMPAADITIAAEYEALQSYSITTEGGGVSCTVDGEEANEAFTGSRVTVSVTPPVGKILEKVTYTCNGQTKEISLSENQGYFTMPAAEVTVTAIYSDVPEKTVTVQESECGTVTLSADKVTIEEVSVTVAAAEGWYPTGVFYSEDGGSSWIEAAYSSGAWRFTPSLYAESVLVRAEYTSQIIPIETEADLRALAQRVNGGDNCADQVVILTNDITLTEEWTPIGSDYDHAFWGTFDGQGHKISELSITSSEQYLGLFGYIKDGTIQNLTVAGSITSTFVYTNTNSGSVPSIGGVVGTALATSSTSYVNFTNCVNEVEITAVYAYVGGIAGYTYNAKFNGCVNEAALRLGSTELVSNLSVGGIVGYTSASSLTQCLNEGDITAAALQTQYTNNQNGQSWDCYDTMPDAGGLMGSGSGTVTSCANHGAVTGTMRFGGGLVGNGNGTLVITDSYNTGAVTSAINYSWTRARMGGLVGSSSNCRYNLTITNSYNASAVTAPNYLGDIGNSPLNRSLRYDEIQANECDRSSTNNAVIKLTNTYGPTDIAALEGGKLTAAALNGDSGTAWKDSDAYGRPILAWESDTADGAPQQVTFAVTPEVAKITVSAKADFSEPCTPDEDGVYHLTPGGYYYKVEAEGYVTETGSFSVSSKAISITVTLRQAATVTFQVTPAGADFTVTNSNGAVIQPDKTVSTDAYTLYTYTLYNGMVYTYSAYADGYNGISREYIVVGDGAAMVELTKRGVATDTVWGDENGCDEEHPYMITQKGVYLIGEGAKGIITIDTTEQVTLLGTGIGRNDVYEDLYINCVQPGTTLTLQDVYINATRADSTVRTNMINFTGAGNTLNFAGTSILDWNTNASGYAMIHVGPSASLTVTGGTAYIYKSEQGAGIGGNGGASGPNGQAVEYNGTITISGATLFMKGSKQGALIGAGATVSSNGTPGRITISGSTLNLITEAKGAAIGSGAGDANSIGPNVTIRNSSVNINVNFSGAGIGGGGWDGGNDTNGGTLTTAGSSIRAFIGQNAASYWGVSECGVNGNKAVTAKVVNSNGQSLYLLEFDTTLLVSSARSFLVTEGNQTVYSGGLHQYGYINENVDKYGGLHVSPTYTIDNWVPMNDSNLYLYLTGEDHTLDVNGEKFKATWDATSQSFTIEAAKAAVLATTVVENGVATTTIDSEALVETLKKAEANTQLLIAAEIPEGEDVYKSVTALTHDDVTNMAAAKIALNVSSPVADILLPNAALKDIANKQGDTVTVSATETQSGTAIEVAVNSVVVDKISGGLRVTLPVTKVTANTALVLVNADGTETVLKDAVFGETSVNVWVDGSCTLKVKEIKYGVNVPVTTVVENGVATTTVDSKDLTNVLQNTDPGSLLIITADIPDGVSVTEAVTVLTRGEVRAIAQANDSIQVSSLLADIVLDNAALLDIAGSQLLPASDEVAITASAQRYGTYIGVTVAGKTMGQVEGGLLVTLPTSRTTAGTVMVQVDAYGNETVIKKSVPGAYDVTARLNGSCTVKTIMNNAKTFADVKNFDWYADAVAFASARELFNGISETEFAPTGLMTRAMLVTVLHRLEDTPAAMAANAFGDVASNTWYTDAVIWANRNKIVEGYGNGCFGPTDNLTREQIATILYRYAQYLGMDASARSSLSRFTDGSETSNWAYEAMQWAVGAGIIEGKGNGTTVLKLDPRGEATRAEVATMLMRMIKLMVQ